jgi:hypothetical protein
LFDAALDDFIPRRKQLIAELKAAGETAAAAQLAAMAKPSRTAWALNQVARRRRELLVALMQAREAVASPKDDPERFRNKTREYRDRVNDVMRAARDVLVGEGLDLNATQTRRLAEPLHAAAAEDGSARARLMAGTLTGDVDAEDPLAGLGLAETEAAPRSRENEEERERRERDERARRVSEASARVAELESAAQDAGARLRRAQGDAERAAREMVQATKAMEAVQSRLERAREELERVGKA